MSLTLWIIFALFLLYRIYRIIYNLYFHPLSKVPGPKLYAISWIPRLWHQQVRGTHWKDLVALHEKYGRIVRTGPDEVSNASAKAWDDICGSKTFVRDLNFLRVTQLDERHSFISPVKNEHNTLRRLLQPAFTDRSLLRHEKILGEWTEKLRLNIMQEQGRELDIAQKLVWMTFDTMGVLSFGESFGCLEKNRQHPYLKAIELGAPFLSLLQIILRYEATRGLYDLFLKLPWMRFWNSLRATAEAKAAKWIENADDSRGDVMSVIWKAMQHQNTPISQRQADDLASILCLAGAESTPVLMSGMMWWILSSPHAHARLKEEIRTAIQESSDITVPNVSKLPYLDACIMESLRQHTPFSVAIPRIVPEGGATVDGYFLPAGTVCGVPHWASAHMTSHFTDPDMFVPERWLPDPDPRYANDKRDTFKPFAKGSLDCIGKRLVYHEVRMVMATLFWHFDMELGPDSYNWVAGTNATVRMMREKGALFIKATPSIRDNAGS
ncbi:trichothecene C-15 hydroxylase [Colletotrichum cereale]|nr:trichothecene C-15 hydroxylase [Colletotrichum cereale]